MGSQSFDLSDLGAKKKIDLSDLGAKPSAVQPQATSQSADTRSWSEKLKLGSSAPGGSFAKGAVDFAEGAVSGAASTVFKTGDIVRRMTGQERILNKPEVQSAMRTPDTAMGKAGKFIEQGAEFAIPIGAAAKVGKIAGLGTAGKVVLESGTSGVVSAAQSGGDPVSTAIGTVAGAAGPIIGAKASGEARVMKEWASKQYARVLNATKQGNKWLSKNEVTPGLLDRGVMAITMKGLQSKIGKNLGKVGAAIGDAWDALPAGSKVGLDEVTSAMDKVAAEAFTLESASGKMVAMGPMAQTGLNNIASLKNTLKLFAEPDPQTGKLLVPIDKIRNLRKYYDGIAAKAGRYQGQALADESMSEAHGMAADAIREELAKAFPDISVLNKEYHFWKDAAKVVGDTILRREGQANPLGRKLAGAAGGAAGFATSGVHGLALGKVAGESLEALVTSPAWNTVSAVMKNKLAKSLAKGSRGESEFWIRKIVKSAGMASVISARTNQSQILTPALAGAQ
jgi:hypothetical protein